MYYQHGYNVYVIVSMVVIYESNIIERLCNKYEMLAEVICGKSAG